MIYDLVIANGRIVDMRQLPLQPRLAHIGIHQGTIQQISTTEHQLQAQRYIDAKGQLVTPGLIDCHTHLVYGGSRANELTLRLQGLSYAEIAEQGGGIWATVQATRAASADALRLSALQRAQVMFNHGTTTIEIKSGYGLDLETEIKMLTVAQSLADTLPVDIITTFLGAHVPPLEYQAQADAYLDYLIQQVLPVIAKQKLAEFVDAFCETVAFNPVQVERLFQAAQQQGLQLKLHAEQLSNQQGALLAARYGALSVDHLEYLSPTDCAQLANSLTTAVLLPGAYYFLNAKQPPPVNALRQHQIPIAIATDANPGTSPFLTLPLMMNMACILFGLSVDEVWLGVTHNAAKAIARNQQLGQIAKGFQADLVIWHTDKLAEIVYQPTFNFCQHIIKAGQVYPRGLQ